MSFHTVHAARSTIAQMPITGRLMPPSAAFEHAAALVVGDHLVEEPLLRAPVVQVVLPDGLTEGPLGELAALPEVHRFAQRRRESLRLGGLVRVALELRAGVRGILDPVEAGG